MKLILVESPTKSNTIQKFLNEEYQVVASYGHVRDLPKSKLGIDIENNFEPHYIIPLKAKKNVTALKKATAKSDTVILATDEDREGEAIAWHLTEALGLNQKPETENRKQKTVLRIVFHEITKRAIEEALKNPRPLDLNLIDAQQARRVLDRLVGYKLSPFLWKKVASGLSAGRVQSVTLRLIVDRENEIRNFKKQEYWTIEAWLQSRGLTPMEAPINAEKTFVAQLAKIGGKSLEKFALANKEQAEKIVNDLKQCDYAVQKIEKKELKKNPPPPFTTSTLQQEAAKRLGFSSKKTMFIAQRLYENGHITYMRTDSVNLSKDAQSAAKIWLGENLGQSYAAEAPRSFTAKSKLVQEAHEAIRPAQIEITPEIFASGDESEKKLYRLIWQRFMASQMPQAKISSTSAEILASNSQLPISNYQLRTTGQQILFDGYLKIWPQKFTENELPPLEENEKLELKELKPEQHFTEPPPRYSEATLVKTLEEYGIGRPSTYAPTISVIQIRNYVKKEAGRFHPTDIGELVNKVLTENFPEVVDIGFTAQMEDELDDIAEGKIKWQGVINKFYKPFAKNLDLKYQEVSKKELIEEKTEEKCEQCGRPMVVKMSRFGKFLGCSGFPECKNIKKLAGANNKEPPKSTGLKCPKCSEGEIVERRVSRGRARGKLFWGCSKYPACDFATWNNPAEENKTKPAGQ